MEILLALAFLVICGIIIFVIEYWWLIAVIIAAIIVTIVIIVLRYENRVKKVVKAEIIDEEPIIERKAENTGYTISYGRHLSSHEHYRYKNVLTGYKITFKVEYANGKRGIIKCSKDSWTYNTLIVLVD